MKVLVTGGAGYIGSVVAAGLLNAGHQVTVLDNLSRGHRQAVPPLAEFVAADLADRDRLARLFNSQRFDAVMHFAAFIEAGESMKCPENFFRNNTANALGVLECMLAAGVKRFVFSSTAALLGIPSALRSRKTIRCSRRMPTASRSCWSRECSTGSIGFTVCGTRVCVTSMPRVQLGQITARRTIRKL